MIVTKNYLCLFEIGIETWYTSYMRQFLAPVQESNIFHKCIHYLYPNLEAVFRIKQRNRLQTF
jgi:hypothetical protein